jgi:hypothetical protein
MTRTDAILAELSRRHDHHHPGFLAAVRPLVDRILEPGLAEPARRHLMELLAETFERDVQVRRDIASAQAASRDFFELLRRLVGGR